MKSALKTAVKAVDKADKAVEKAIAKSVVKSAETTVSVKKSKPSPMPGQGDLLYHVVHGLCRVSRVETERRPGVTKVTNLVLQPRTPDKMGIRYVIPAGEMENTGFHALVSTGEAQRILEYLKKGKADAAATQGLRGIPGNFAEENQTWALARTLVACCREEGRDAKDKRLRDALARCVKGLVGELSHVLKITPEQTVQKLRDALGSLSRKNELVSAAFISVLED